MNEETNLTKYGCTLGGNEQKHNLTLEPLTGKGICWEKNTFVREDVYKYGHGFAHLGGIEK